MALVDPFSKHLILNISDDPETHAIPNDAAHEEEIEIDVETSRKKSVVAKQEVSNLYKRFMQQNNLDAAKRPPLTRRQ